MNKLSIILGGCVLLFGGYSPRVWAQGTLTVEVTGVRNSHGKILWSVYNSADGFPSKNAAALKSGTAEAQAGTTVFQLPALPAGVYAVSVLHDENNNGKMDTNWVGMPNEGYGASNDAPARLGPPKFEDAKFRLSEKGGKISLKMRY